MISDALKQANSVYYLRLIDSLEVFDFAVPLVLRSVPETVPTHTQTDNSPLFLILHSKQSR